MDEQESQEITQAKSSSSQLTHLELIVAQIGDAVLATTDTVQTLAARVDLLASQIERQQEQMEQQRCQIFALSESLKTLVEINSESTAEMRQLTAVIQTLFLNLSNQDS